MAVIRFGVSLEADLMGALDSFVQENAFTNRSQAIRFLIEKNIVERKWQCNNEVAGAIVLHYDAVKNDIAIRLLEIQQKYSQYVLSAQRFFLNKNSFLEVVTVRGIAQRLTELSDSMISLKGIKHGKLIMSRTD
jgi:CopG family nickel-responsive transcriptional regulator